MTGRTINLIGRSREDLLVIAERACSTLCNIASNLTTGEGDADVTEEDIGLPVEEVIEMAHDGMIGAARSVLDSILRDYPK